MDVKDIKEISQALALKLNKEYGVPFGEDGLFASKPHGKSNKYYITMSYQNMQLLKKLNK